MINVYRDGVFRMVLLLMAVVLLATGCENDSGSLGDGHDFGDNDPELYVAVGDSITEGVGGATPYPVILSSMLGKTVINDGRGGERVGVTGVARSRRALDRYQPGFLLVMYGLNDVFDGYGADNIGARIREIIQAAKGNQTIPVVSTITPAVGTFRVIFNPGIVRANEEIKRVCAEEGVVLVDCYAVIEGRADYVQSDGIHLTDAGASAVAAQFLDAL